MLEWAWQENSWVACAPSPQPLCLETELAEYLCGVRQSFTPCWELRGTAFQLSVWEAISAIPYGQVRTYSDLARAVGHPRAGRAVGNAVGANPLPVIIPCHRVVRMDGTLGGYSGPRDLKPRLLEMEWSATREPLPVPAPGLTALG